MDRNSLPEGTGPVVRALWKLEALAEPFQPLVAKLEPKKEPVLQHCYVDTYWRLRAWLSAIAFAFPVGIPLAGWAFYDIPFRKSISAYYFAEGGSGEPNMRIWFFGGLFVLGILLLVYKGFSKLEDRLLTFAGACGIGVAMVPMHWPESAQWQLLSVSTMHFVLAFLLFGAITWVCLGCKWQTLQYATPEVQARMTPLYNIAGALMGAFILIGLAIAFFFDRPERWVYWVELAGIWIFSAFWALKNWELGSLAPGFDTAVADSPEAKVTVGQVTEAVSLSPGAKECVAQAGLKH